MNVDTDRGGKINADPGGSGSTALSISVFHLPKFKLTMPNYDFNFSEEKKSEGKQKISALMCISAPIVAVKVAVTKNLVAVKGSKVAVVLV